MGPLGHSVAALAALVAAPLAGAALLLRPAWRRGWRERLGEVSCEGSPSLWLHAASLGETRAALPLARAFAEAGETLYLSHTRADALAVGFDLGAGRPALLGRGVAPLDHPWCAARALDAVGARAIVLVETELWPTGIREAAARGIAVGVVSASISDRSFEGYRRFARFMRPTFERLSFVGAQTEQDAQRFAALGTREGCISVTGDLKRDAVSASAAVPLEVLACIAGRPAFFAGSTHDGEEAAVLEAYASVRAALPELVCVIAPRRVERCAEVSALAKDFGLSTRLRSASGASPLARGEVLLLDSLGELAACYAVANVAFVGGSLVPMGGHNLYEPFHAGAFVLHGPHVASAASAARELAEAGVAGCVRSSSELAGRLIELFGSAAEPRAGLAERAVRGSGNLESPGVATRTCAFVAGRIGSTR